MKVFSTYEEYLQSKKGFCKIVLNPNFFTTFKGIESYVILSDSKYIYFHDKAQKKGKHGSRMQKSDLEDVMCFKDLQ